jgi:TRAP-type C4-dicarboxylate transport system permease small subunit
MNRTIERIDKVILKINETALVIALALMFVLVFANVVGRYFFSFTYYWIDELSRYLMISLAFLGFGLAMRQGNHSSFTILQNLLPDKFRFIMRGIVFCILLAAVAGLCYLGFIYAWANLHNRTEALRWPTGMWYMTIPLGSFLFIWHSLMIAGGFIKASRDADIEREIAQGGELVNGSALMEGIDINAKEEEK